MDREGKKSLISYFSAFFWFFRKFKKKTGVNFVGRIKERNLKLVLQRKNKKTGKKKKLKKRENKIFFVPSYLNIDNSFVNFKLKNFSPLKIHSRIDLRILKQHSFN